MNFLRNYWKHLTLSAAALATAAICIIAPPMAIAGAIMALASSPAFAAFGTAAATVATGVVALTAATLTAVVGGLSLAIFSLIGSALFGKKGGAGTTTASSSSSSSPSDDDGFANPDQLLGRSSNVATVLNASAPATSNAVTPAASTTTSLPISNPTQDEHLTGLLAAGGLNHTLHAPVSTTSTSAGVTSTHEAATASL